MARLALGTREIGGTSISRQVVFLLLAFTIFPMAMLTVTLYLIDRTTHQQEIARVQKDVAGRMAQLVESHVKGSLGSLDILTLSRDLVKEDPLAVQRIFSNFIDRQPNFDTLALVHPDGRFIYRYSQFHTYLETSPTYCEKDPGFLKACQGEAGLGEVRILEFSLFPTLRLYMPVFTVDRGVKAIVCADLNISRIWRLASKAFTSEDVTAYIVDRNGILIAADDLSMVLERRDLKGIESVHQYLLGRRGGLKYSGITGSPVMGVLERIDLTGWGVVAETPVSIAFHNMRLLWRTFWIALICMNVLAGSFGWLFCVRRIIHPIRELQKEVQVIATGDLDHRIVPKGPNELRKLATDLSAMVESLKTLTVSKEMLSRENLERQRSEAALRENERRLADILDFFPNATLAVDKDRQIIIWNKAIEEMTGIPAGEMIGKGNYAYTIPFYGERRSQLMDLIWQETEDVASRYPFIRKEGNSYTAEVFCPALYNGRGAWIFCKASPLYDPKGEIIGAIESIRDITDYKRAQEALEKRIVALTQPLDTADGIEFEDLFNLEEIQKLQDQFANATGVASIITHTDGTPITKPSNFCKLCEEIIRKTEKGLRNCYKSDAVLGRNHPEGPIIQPCLSCGFLNAGASITVGGRHIANWLIGQVRTESQDEAKMRAYAREIGAEEEVFIEAFKKVSSMPREQFESIAQALFTLAGQISAMAYQNVQQARFISEARRSAEEKQRLQDQLIQAQKMESVGRLAGGVAHDFNNMLQVISGYTDLSLSESTANTLLHGYLLEIQQAAKRSTVLVQQLLIFARKQIVSPRVLDLNAEVSSSISMLRRVIGENIDLAWRPGLELWSVRIDPSQVHQLLTNLAVNARDAIAAGMGKITIETENRVLDETFCHESPGSSPGNFVMLAVQDTGCGMGPDVLKHIFEPFYTMKGVGVGTGLGLSTVYGIVEQNNGFITVSSSPGNGARFEIFLPREAMAGAEILPRHGVEISQTGDETLLIVEDDKAILELSRATLERLGYTVLTADAPEKAISMVKTHEGKIDLLLTDIVMPQMNGRELYRRLSVILPDIKCLFMSGYSDEVIAHHGILDKGVRLLYKPFSLTELAGKVREALSIS